MKDLLNFDETKITEEVAELLLEKNKFAEEALIEFLENCIPEIKEDLKLKLKNEDFKFKMLKGIIEMSAIVEVFTIPDDLYYKDIEKAYLLMFSFDTQEVKFMKNFLFHHFILNKNVNNYCNDPINSLEYIERVNCFKNKYLGE